VTAGSSGSPPSIRNMETSDDSASGRDQRRWCSRSSAMKPAIAIARPGSMNPLRRRAARRAAQA
jgi:hypothetical protein